MTYTWVITIDDKEYKEGTPEYWEAILGKVINYFGKDPDNYREEIKYD